jgi:hypothetical protein
MAGFKQDANGSRPFGTLRKKPARPSPFVAITYLIRLTVKEACACSRLLHMTNEAPAAL